MQIPACGSNFSLGFFGVPSRLIFPFSYQNGIKCVRKGSIPIGPVGANMVYCFTKKVLSCLGPNKCTSIGTNEIFFKFSYNRRSVFMLKTAISLSPVPRTRDSIKELDVIKRDHYVSIRLASLDGGLIKKRLKEFSTLGY